MQRPRLWQPSAKRPGAPPETDGEETDDPVTCDEWLHDTLDEPMEAPVVPERPTSKTTPGRAPSRAFRPRARWMLSTLVVVAAGIAAALWW